MSVFLAPSSIDRDPRQAGQFRAFFALGIIRQLFLLLAFFGALGILLQFFILGILHQTPLSLTIIRFCGGLLSQALFPVWLGLCLAGLTVCVVSSIAAGKLATRGGKALLEAMRDDPCERSLLTLLQQVGDAAVLLRPTFRLGRESYGFDLALVSSHGVTFVRSSPNSAASAEVGPIQAACSRLSDQYSLPLLRKTRFIQLWEPKSGPDWQTSQPRDLGRFFQRSELAATRQEIAHSFRGLYNLALPADQTAVPVQGSLPASAQMRAHVDSGVPRKGRFLAVLGRLLFLACFLLLLGTLGVFLLQFINYETAEKVLIPARAVLRHALPSDWQDRLGLGRETYLGEQHIYATVARAPFARLALAVGREGTGSQVRIGTELRILQAAEEQGRRWFLVSLPGATGWLPSSAVRPRHVVPKGSALYARPDLRAEPRSYTLRDEPAALVYTWRRQTPGGEIVWRKMLFLDRTTAYLRTDS